MFTAAVITYNLTAFSDERRSICLGGVVDLKQLDDYLQLMAITLCVPCCAG